MRNYLFPPKRNQVSLLLILVFVLQPVFAEAQASPPIYARVSMYKVADGKQKEYEQFVKDVIKPVQLLRRQKGRIVQWIFFKVHFAGASDEYHYVGVGYYPGWANTEAESLGDLLRQANPDSDPVALEAKMRELRTFVREYVLRQVEAIEPNPPVPSKYVQLGYMKVKPGKSADYLKAERDDWMPVHQSLINEGQSSGWGLWQVVFPAGTSMPYDYVTSNRFTTYAQVSTRDFEKTFKKVSPSKNMTEVLNRTTQSRDLVKNELWEVVDMLQ